MKEMMGSSATGNLKEAIKGITNPSFLILIASDKERFPTIVKDLEEAFPNIPSIGCVGQSYLGTTVCENGITVIGMNDNIRVSTGILSHVSTMPIKDIKKFKENLDAVGGDASHTVCIDLCSSNDECVIASMQSVLSQKGISLTGGTVWDGLVSCNGAVYEDSTAYAFIHNLSGKVKVYKENLYVPTDKVHMVTKANPASNEICELDGQPAETVYTTDLGITPDKIDEQTFTNPLGRCLGDEIYIVSIKERLKNKTFSCYRKTYPKDILCILDVNDYDSIVKNTVHNIKQDFPHASGIFSINCIFRYLFFQRENYMQNYLELMQSAAPHAGLIGLGEHYQSQHTNQTMSCVVFE